ncbi:TPA: TetR/AcrR family transcriptional regulator, partial [Streptococcus pyogenes]|nr:TetR/AcrR family transcriptional regulator [Streptococcus pyogenes]
KWWLHQRQRMSANELLKYYLELIK